MQPAQNAPTLIRSMTVDVRLCGSIPRQDMVKDCLLAEPAKEKQKQPKVVGAPLSPLRLTSRGTRLSASYLAATNGPKHDSPTHRTIGVCEDHLGSLILQNTSEAMRGMLREKQLYQRHNAQPHQPLAPMFDPPSWAVPAKGETRLEPVCESVGRQCPVDLTKRPCYRVGRSPNSDIQLMHATSSRRHAMLFHHANGSCYVVDCGSAHGTYVNGVRISPPGDGGVVVPHKVRRGALIRFGGVGAPSFVLKSFSFSLNDISERKRDKPDMGELVRRNTRMNALGKTTSERVRERIDFALTMALAISRKRSFDSLDSRDTIPFDEPCSKRARCSSPPLSPEQPLHLVSPDLPCMTIVRPRRVTFSNDPPQAFYPSLVTPEVLSGDEDNDSV